jgi:hypothetical protein
MRFWVTLVLSGSLAIVGCGQDGGANPRSTCLTDGTGGTGGSGGVNPSSPVLTNIAWDALGFCQEGARNSYNIFVFALDPDTPALDLIFDVNVPDCSPVSHLGNVFVVSCPNNAPTSGVACAEDPDGNTSSRAEFTFQPCIPGNCRQFPDSCDMLGLDRATP